MKKILALALAIIMMAAIAAPAMAAETAAPDETTSEQVKVEYGVLQAYILTIPEDVSLAETADDTVTGSGEVKLDNIVIAGNDTITVTVASENNWKLKADASLDNTDVDYYMAKSADDAATACTNGTAFTGNIIESGSADGNNGTEGKSVAQNIYFHSKGTAQEGVFTDYLTFTVKITAANS